MAFGVMEMLLTVNIGTLAAVVYALRLIFMTNKRIEVMMKNQGISQKNFKMWR